LVGELVRQLAKLKPDDPRYVANLDHATSQTAEMRTRP
jgi:hypothetical protein